MQAPQGALPLEPVPLPGPPGLQPATGQNIVIEMPYDRAFELLRLLTAAINSQQPDGQQRQQGGQLIGNDDGNGHQQQGMQPNGGGDGNGNGVQPMQQ